MQSFRLWAGDVPYLQLLARQNGRRWQPLASWELNLGERYSALAAGHAQTFLV